MTSAASTPTKKIEELISKARKHETNVQTRIWFHFLTFSVVETIAQRQRDLLDFEYAEMMETQDPEVYPGFYEGDMAGVDEVRLSL